MKNFYILLIAVTVILASSCGRSQFSTTTRHSENGKVSYVNNYHNERIKLPNVKGYKSHVEKNEAQNYSPAPGIKGVRNLPGPEISKLNPVPASGNENLIASISNKSTGIAMNGSRVDPNKAVIFSDNNLPSDKNDNFYTATIRKNPPKNEQTKPKSRHYKKIEPFGFTGFILSVIGWIPVIGLLSPNSAASWMFCTGLLMAISAVILGTVGLRKINRNQGHYKGKGFAIAAILVGISAFLSGIIILIAAMSTLQ